MRKIREVLRLRYELGLSERQIASSVNLSRAGVGGYLRRAREVGVGWPLPEGMTDEALETLVYGSNSPANESAKVDWAKIHQELRRPGVTLELLWREYRQQCSNGDGLAYSTFTIKYGEWKKGLDLTMRQFHRAGEKLFVDWAGTPLKLTDPHTGEVREGQVFVAVLGASN